MLPKVTIAIPVYNEEKYLSRTIESALNQTYKNIEVLISDNCSTDGSLSIVKEFVSKDSRVKLFQKEKNIGVIENFDFLRKVASTPYFMWLGAHDVINERYIEDAVVNFEKQADLVLYYPKSLFFEKEGKFLQSADSQIECDDSSASARMLTVVLNLNWCTAFHGVYRTNILNKLPYDKNGIDILILFLLASYGKIKSSNEVMYSRRIVRKESKVEFMERMKEYKIGESSDANTYRNEVYMVHFKYLNGLDHLSVFEKLALILKLKDIFTYRYGDAFYWRKIFNYFTFVNFNLQVLILILLANILNLSIKIKRKIRG
jgi:glycosyltransferase involved in cell wall biosynthesis